MKDLCNAAKQWPKKHCHHNKGYYREKEKWEGLKKAKSITSMTLTQTEHTFHLLKGRLKGENSQNKQQLKEAAVHAWKSITKEEWIGGVSGLAAWCSYCKHRKCNQKVLFIQIYFKAVYSNTLPKHRGGLPSKEPYSTFTQLDVIIRELNLKFYDQLFRIHLLILTPNAFSQCLAKTKEL